jgi:prolyl oligopeptidase
LRNWRRAQRQTAKYLNSGLWLHQLGSPAEKDVAILGVGLNPKVSVAPVDTPFMITGPGSARALAVINHGAAAEVTVYLATLGQIHDTQSAWVKIADESDAVANVAPEASRLGWP